MVKITFQERSWKYDTYKIYKIKMMFHVVRRVVVMEYLFTELVKNNHYLVEISNYIFRDYKSLTYLLLHTLVYL